MTDARKGRERAGGRLRPVPIDEASLGTGADVLERLQFHVITEVGEWLRVTYGLFASEFAPDVLDPYDRYVEWVEWNRRLTHPFPLILIAAYIPHGDEARLVAAIGGNVMPVAECLKATTPVREPLPIADGSCVFAIGHQMTSPVLRARGVRGVGRRLFWTAVQEAHHVVQQSGHVLRYCVLEAENAAVGFWSHLGFRWPEGLAYWQPPLEFDPFGRGLYPEVPLRLMLLPQSGVSNGAVNRTLVLNIVATVYLNWSLHAYRRTLGDEAMRHAEDEVMGRLFRRVCEAAPQPGPLPLVRVPPTASVTGRC